MTNSDIRLSDETLYFTSPLKYVLYSELLRSSSSKVEVLFHNRWINQTKRRSIEDATFVVSWIWERRYPLTSFWIGEPSDRTYEYTSLVNLDVIVTIKSQEITFEIDPFQISYNDFLSLTRDEQKEVQNKSYLQREEWIEKELAIRNAEWILVCKDEVIDSSYSLEECPSHDVLEKIAEEKNCVPYIFVKPPVIEESSLWSRLKNEDYYPTLKFEVGSSAEDDYQSSCQIISDFDTGCPFTYLNLGDLIKNKIIPEPHPLDRKITRHLGRQANFFTQKVKVYIKNREVKSKDFIVRCVEDWDVSPFKLVNPKRKALAGRDFLLKFPLKIELNGKNRRTKVI